MVNLELVEKLRQHADITYEEARKVLEETGGDILDAIVLLENQNRIKSPSGGGYYNSKEGQEEEYHNDKNGSYGNHENTSFGELVRRFLKWAGKLIDRGNKNSFEVKKADKNIITIPVTILVLLLFIMFWVIIPLMVVGLFFGYRFSFKGPDLGKENINKAMDSVADAAENFKKDVKGGKSDGENSDN